MSSSQPPSSPHSTPSPGPFTSCTPRIVILSSTPASTSTRPIALPASSDEPKARRARSTSDLVQLSDLTDHAIVQVSPTHASFLPSSNTFGNDRSGPLLALDEGEKGADHPLSASWWGAPKKKVPSEKTEALQSTRKRVAQAIASAADIAHETLYIGVGLLDLAPIPGLKPAAQLLLNIWDASQQVDMNRLGCLRLTERCADILLSVREEISEAGDVLGQELAAPVRKLEESFQSVHHFLIKQISRPFLRRYLRRNEILGDILTLDNSLRDALGWFGISIQFRILKQVLETEMRRQADAQETDRRREALLEMITTDGLPLLTPDSNALGLFEDAQPLSTPPENLSSSQVIPALDSLHSLQNSSDTEKDTTNLRQLMQDALQTTSDAQMLEVLEIGRQEMPDAIKALQRALEHITEPLPMNDVVAGPGGPRNRAISFRSSSTDTLHREFIESGIDALRRMSRDLETSLPSWTITKYEIDRDEKIGIGFFSDVYKGTWEGRTVAIKVLAKSTSKELFVSEIGIWKTLHHPNVLPLYGASSASGDPPWFFVSSYMKNGSLVEYLRRLKLEQRPNNLDLGGGSAQMPLSPIRSLGSNLISENFPAPWTGVRGISPTRRDLTPPGSRGRASPQEDTTIHREWDLFRFMHQIAKGMEYLHSRGVLHGDLKCANVLVNDKYRCVISDFGQSEMKSEAYRISRTPLPHGTLRWQSPELMAGQIQLTQEIDVWAFSICCVEILTMGRIPWPFDDDDSVRRFVLTDDSRPPLPDNSRFNTRGLQDILRVCWSTLPVQRPTFSKLVNDFKQLRKNYGQEIVDSPRDSVIDEAPEIPASPSPDMRPTNSPRFLQNVDTDPPNDILPEFGNIFQTLRESPGSSDVLDLPDPESTVSSEGTTIPGPVISTIDESKSANIRNERRYRLFLIHDYHPSLRLPLWDPSPVEVGAVGYLSKPRGQFVTLFNALTPGKAEHLGIQSLPSIHGYGPVQVEIYRQDRRTVTQKSMDVFTSLLNFGTFSQTESRRYSYPLIAGHEMAHLCTETADYLYLERLEAPKKWFRTHVDFIMQTYGSQHRIQKEDLFLVIGALCTPNYALFVSHGHPQGGAHFIVYKTPKKGRPWGTFAPDTGVPQGHGPSDDESNGDTTPVQAKKVSSHGGPWDTVLLARLRFKPDSSRPTAK